MRGTGQALERCEHVIEAFVATYEVEFYAGSLAGPGTALEVGGQVLGGDMWAWHTSGERAASSGLLIAPRDKLEALAKRRWGRIGGVGQDTLVSLVAS